MALFNSLHLACGTLIKKVGCFQQWLTCYGEPCTSYTFIIRAWVNGFYLGGRTLWWEDYAKIALNCEVSKQCKALFRHVEQSRGGGVRNCAVCIAHASCMIKTIAGHHVATVLMMYCCMRGSGAQILVHAHGFECSVCFSPCPASWFFVQFAPEKSFCIMCQSAHELI